jgi:putative FmdB family regulatory protein
VPIYRFRCEPCGDFEEWFSIHVEAVMECPDCGRPTKKVMTVPHTSVFAGHGKQEVANRVWAESALEKDLPAYKELRRQGLQPPRIDGSHILARDATDPIDVEMGKKAFVDKSSYNRAREINASLAESSREGFAAELGKARRGA